MQCLPVSPGAQTRARFAPGHEALRGKTEARPPFKLERVCRFCRKGRRGAAAGGNRNRSDLCEAPEGPFRQIGPVPVSRRGAAAVEFAVLAPVFFLLVFGMIEFGRMIMVQQIITNAAREGARMAVLDGATTGGSDGVVTRVVEYLQGAGIEGASITVSPDPPDSAGWGEPVTVAVRVPFSQVTWLPTPMFVGGDMELSSGATMRRETVQ